MFDVYLNVDPKHEMQAIGGSTQTDAISVGEHRAVAVCPAVTTTAYLGNVSASSDEVKVEQDDGGAQSSKTMGPHRRCAVSEVDGVNEMEKKQEDEEISESYTVEELALRDWLQQQNPTFNQYA